MGIGAVVGFAATFTVGSPVSADGALHLVIQALWAGIIFGIIGFATGAYMHRFVAELLDKEIDSLMLAKELKRQEKLERIDEANKVMELPGMEQGGEFTAELLTSPTVEGAGNISQAEPPPVESEMPAM